jgi:hypothetical protein
MHRGKQEWIVLIPKKICKQRQKLPIKEDAILKALIDDLRFGGPMQGAWPNYSKLGKDKHHCHLSKKWVACWDVEKKIIRLYYVGSRKDAPY